MSQSVLFWPFSQDVFLKLVLAQKPELWKIKLVLHSSSYVAFMYISQIC